MHDKSHETLIDIFTGASQDFISRFQRFCNLNLPGTANDAEALRFLLDRLIEAKRLLK